MNEGTRLELALYRIEKSKQTLNASKIMFENNMYQDSVNRSYYAIFHAARALLALEGVDYKKHSGVISHFQRNYIKTGIFEVKYSEVIKTAFDMRTESDYEDFFIFSKEEVQQQIIDANDFIIMISRYINDNC